MLLQIDFMIGRGTSPNSKTMKVTASVITLIASASAASYQWVGWPTNFNDALNWQREHPPLAAPPTAPPKKARWRR